MGTQIIVTIVAGILLVVAAIGTVYPLLPGSLLALVTLVVWAWIIDSWAAWTVAVIGSLLVVAGWSASAVLTGRKLKQRRSPRHPVPLPWHSPQTLPFLSEQEVAPQRDV